MNKIIAALVLACGMLMTVEAKAQPHYYYYSQPRYYSYPAYPRVYYPPVYVNPYPYYNPYYNPYNPYNYPGVYIRIR